MADGNGSGGMTVIALVLGALVVLVIGLYAGGVFTRRDATATSSPVESPATPESSNDSSPPTTPEPSTTPPSSTPAEPTPSEQPAPETPSTTPPADQPQPSEPTPAPPPAQ